LKVLGRSGRACFVSYSAERAHLVSELVTSGTAGNQETFSTDDAYRSLDTMHRLLSRYRPPTKRSR